VVRVCVFSVCVCVCLVCVCVCSECVCVVSVCVECAIGMRAMSGDSYVVCV